MYAKTLCLYQHNMLFLIHTNSKQLCNLSEW